MKVTNGRNCFVHTAIFVEMRKVFQWSKIVLGANIFQNLCSDSIPKMRSQVLRRSGQRDLGGDWGQRRDQYVNGFFGWDIEFSLSFVFRRGTVVDSSPEPHLDSSTKSFRRSSMSRGSERHRGTIPSSTFFGFDFVVHSGSLGMF